MHAAVSRRFGLSKSLGLDCTKDGLTLADVPLLHRTVRGFTPRDALEIRWLLERAYGSVLDTDRMAVTAPRYFRLSKTFGLDCTPDGVTLAGVPLLQPNGSILIAEAPSFPIISGVRWHRSSAAHCFTRRALPGSYRIFRRLTTKRQAWSSAPRP